MSKTIGILTAGGDTPGLNAAMRGLGKAALETHVNHIIGFYDGFRGLMENRTLTLDESALSGILTRGGTILGTSRDKPNKMPIGGKTLDMTDVMVENYKNHHLDVLICMGGGGTQKSAYRLVQKGLNIITLPKTIDNDIARTDVTFGFDTALTIATEAIDRLHSTAHSHHRIIVVEVMGHNAGWLALGAGIAGGADVILIPEIPYDSRIVAEAILSRVRSGKRFSIIAVSEGALSREDRKVLTEAEEKLEDAKKDGDEKKARKAQEFIEAFTLNQQSRTIGLTADLEKLTSLETRMTILGHVQRGGTPTANDRLLATRLGTCAADFIEKERYGIMVAARGQGIEPVPLGDVIGKLRTVPLDHDWILSARRVGTCLGD